MIFSGQISIRPDIDILNPDIDILRPDINILRPDSDILRPYINILRLYIDILRPDIDILKADMDISCLNLEDECNLECFCVPFGPKVRECTFLEIYIFVLDICCQQFGEYMSVECIC